MFVWVICALYFAAVTGNLTIKDYETAFISAEVEDLWSILNDDPEPDEGSSLPWVFIGLIFLVCLFCTGGYLLYCARNDPTITRRGGRRRRRGRRPSKSRTSRQRKSDLKQASQSLAAKLKSTKESLNKSVVSNKSVKSEKSIKSTKEAASIKSTKEPESIKSNRSAARERSTKSAASERSIKSASGGVLRTDGKKSTQWPYC